MDALPKRAVLYAAKSTEDVHGSIPGQLADCRAMADREGWEVPDDAVYSDEGFSAYKGNRGPGLEQAKAHAARLAAEAGEQTMLAAQHTDRFARGAGDAPGAADHLGEIYFAMRRQNVRLRTVQDDHNLEDPLRAVLAGERGHEDSARKSAATARGQRSRFEAGKRLGSPIPDGYRLEPILGADGKPLIDRSGRAERECVLDGPRARVWRRIFDLVEQGHTFGQVREILNGEGIRTGRGGPWTTRTIRRGVLNDWYCGRAHAYDQTIENDHPALIEPERWERIAAGVQSDDPVSARTRAGGRPAKDNADDYLLRGIANCGRCGASLWTRRLAAGRHYVCRAVREGHGSCDAPYIPAEAAERAVIRHLDSFIADLESWLTEKAGQADTDRQRFADALNMQRRELAASSRRIERAQSNYERAVDAGNDDRADVALDEIARLKREHADHVDMLGEAERRLAEWPSPPEIDQALDVYSRLRDAFQGRVRAAESTRELNATLKAALAEASLVYEVAGSSGVLSLIGTFRLRVTDDVRSGALPHRLKVADRPVSSTYDREYLNPSEEPATTCS